MDSPHRQFAWKGVVAQKIIISAAKDAPDPAAVKDPAPVSEQVGRRRFGGNNNFNIRLFGWFLLYELAVGRSGRGQDSKPLIRTGKPE